MVLALPPLNIFPTAFISLIIFMWSLMYAKTARNAFLRGWLFGCGFFICGLYWMSFALAVDLDKFGVYLPLSLIVLPALFAIYTGIIGCLVHVVALRTRNPEWAIPLVLPLAWTLGELLRGHLFTGFPWNSLGYIWTNYPIGQLAAIFGVYGVGFLTCIAASAFGMFLLTRQPSHHRQAWLCVGIGIMCLLYAAGYQRVIDAQNRHNDSAVTVPVRIVQPNIPQGQKWDAARRADNFQKLLALSATDTAGSLIVWPETASPYILDDVHQARLAISRILQSETGVDKALIAGTIRHQDNAYFNSAEIIDSAGMISGRYDKFHLVPFGEFMPLKKWLPFPALANMFGGIGEGTGPQTITLTSLGTLKISPLICYEVIFPGAVTDHTNRPQLLVNITNDAWYGNTLGPYQHLAQAQMRAIEEGLPMVRAANTGISAVIDSYGNIVQQTKFGVTAAFDAAVKLPPADYIPSAANGGFYIWLTLLMIAYTIGIGFMFVKMPSDADVGKPAKRRVPQTPD